MRKEVISSGNLEVFAEIALFFFVAAFAVILIRALLMPKETVHQLENMPLNDDVGAGSQENSHG